VKGGSGRGDAVEGLVEGDVAELVAAMVGEAEQDQIAWMPTRFDCRQVRLHKRQGRIVERAGNDALLTVIDHLDLGFVDKEAVDYLLRHLEGFLPGCSGALVTIADHGVFGVSLFTAVEQGDSRTLKTEYLADHFT